MECEFDFAERRIEQSKAESKSGTYELRNELLDSFNHVRKDFNKIGEWIIHVDNCLLDIRDRIEKLEGEK